MKKILLIIFTIILILSVNVLAVDIDIGCPAIIRQYAYGDDIYTIINVGNPANETGKITSVEIYSATEIYLLGVTVATFYVVNGNMLSTRDYEYIGDVTPGAKRIFAVDLDVQAGDYLGFVSSDSSNIQCDTSGGDNTWFKLGNFIPCSDTIFGVDTGWVISLYGTGATIGWPHKWNTQTISKWNTKEFTKWNDLE